MDTASPILVTGASGFLGGHVLAAACSRPVLAAWRTRAPAASTGAENIRLDLSREDELEALFATRQISGVLHLAAEARPNTCSTDPDAASRINVQASSQLAKLCAAADIPLVFTSTDLVFDGKSAPYAEDAPPCPISAYGEQKAAAERAVLAAHPKACVARLSLLYGLLPERPNYLDSLLEQARCGQPSPVFVDEWRTPLWAADAANGLWMLFEKRASGMVHLAGPKRLSRAEFASVFAECLPEIGVTLAPCAQADVPMAAARPKDVCLLAPKAKALGFAPLTPRQAFKLLAPALSARVSGMRPTD